MDKIKRYIDCYIPTETCNLRCHYCYITQKRKFNGRLASFSRPVAVMVKALSVERLGGPCLLNMCAGGETLLSEQVLPLVRALIEAGHYVMVVTNGTVTQRFREITAWPPEVRERLFIKLSFHYLEILRRNLMDRFFGNVALMKENGVSFTVEVTPSDELIPHIGDLKQVCMDRLGALCHITIARDDRTGGIDVLSRHSFEDYQTIWGQFDSELFRFKARIFCEKHREFCYAGDWSGYLNLDTGDLRQCYCGKVLGNIYENVDAPIPFEPIGAKCPFPHCYNGHSFLALGDIPEMDTPTYAQLRDRDCQDGSRWLTPTMAAFLSGKLAQSNRPLSSGEKKAMARREALLYPLRRLHGYLHETWALWRYLKFPLGKKAYIIGTPAHTNLGDSAIVLAQEAFLARCGLDKSHIKGISHRDYEVNRDRIRRWLPRNGLIAQLGGGNMGSQWPAEEALHRDLTTAFAENPMVIFPQTIYYGPESDPQPSIPVYNGRENLMLTARERRSYEIMTALYPDTEVLLVPDIVLSAHMDTFGVQPRDREGVLLCLRADAERAMTDETRWAVEEMLNGMGLPVVYTDMHSACRVTEENRAALVRRKMEEFAGARLVITDRLHGMIFAAITGTPCIVFRNYNHKVRGTYEWLQYLPYIRYAESVADVEAHLPKLLAMGPCRYDSAPLEPHFEKLAKVVREYAHNQRRCTRL